MIIRKVGMVKYLRAMDSDRAEVLCYFLKVVNNSNIVRGDVKSIAKELNVAKYVVSSVIEQLEDVNLIKELKTGALMLSPDLVLPDSIQERRVVKHNWRNS